MNIHSQQGSAGAVFSLGAQPSVGACLAHVAATGLLEAPRELWGFGGLHGGLVLAAALAAVRASGATEQLRSVRGAFLRPVREPSVIETAAEGETTGVTSVSARVTARGRTFATATAVYGASRGRVGQPWAPPAPHVPSWETCDVLEFPRTLVPVAAQTEIRPVGESRPFAGGTDPQLTAWVRLRGDDAPPDTLRLIFLLDALAPSYAAVMDRPLPIPTVEMSAYLTHPRASSPWVLLSARTCALTEDGWISEQIDAWDLAGHHLAQARQLRVIARPRHEGHP